MVFKKCYMKGSAIVQRHARSRQELPPDRLSSYLTCDRIFNPSLNTTTKAFHGGIASQSCAHPDEKRKEIAWV